MVAWSTVVESAASGLLPAIVLAGMGLLQQRVLQGQNRYLELLKGAITARCAFLDRKIEAHEQLWPLVAAANRSQLDLATVKGTGQDLAPFAKAISKARADLKNFVYDHGLYFDEEVRKLTQDLDTALGKPAVLDVKKEITALETKLRAVIEELGPAI